MLARLPRFSAVLTLAAVVLLAGCTSSGGGSTSSTTPPIQWPNGSSSPSETSAPSTQKAQLQRPADATTVLTGTDSDSAAELALEASQTFFAAAPVAVLAPTDDEAAGLRAASAALALGAPLLLGDDGVRDEFERLGTEAVLTFGDVEVSAEAEGVTQIAAPADDDALAKLLGQDSEEPLMVDDGKQVRAIMGLPRGSFTPLALAQEESGEATEPEHPNDSEDTDDPGDIGEASDEQGDVALPETTLAEPLSDVLVAATNSRMGAAAVATAAAAGAHVVLMPGGDPRASNKTVQAVAEAEAKHVVGIGAAFQDAQTLEWRVAAAATGVELPGGGQLVFPGKRYVALYGTPSSTALGVLGEQDVPKTIARAKKHAKAYDDLSEDAVIPALEIIATVASSGAGDDGNYSNELPVEQLRPLIEAAHEAGQYVLLDLQPGRSSFVEQAKQYSELLELPYVGLALDPEWNLGPKQKHLTQIGSATAKEINEVVHWLADFTRERALPQKMLVLHQFQVRMIQSITDVDLTRSELAILVHADGQGGQPAKQDTWRTLHANAPDIEWWGWKNFYDEDSPMLTPEQTAQVKPFPNFISYQ